MASSRGRAWLRRLRGPTIAFVGLSALISAEARADDLADVSTSWRLLGQAAVGAGLRFNNPYRLQTQLGSDARSLSLTSGYVDLGVAAALGQPNGAQHGAALRLSVALAGVGQQVLTPSYFVAYRGEHAFMGYGRLGPSIVLAPDPNVGGEVAGGLAWFFTSGLGLTAELVFNVYAGAGTFERTPAVYPILSGQLGLVIDYEVLP